MDQPVVFKLAELLENTMESFPIQRCRGISKGEVENGHRAHVKGSARVSLAPGGQEGFFYGPESN